MLSGIVNPSETWSIEIQEDKMVNWRRSRSKMSSKIHCHFPQASNGALLTWMMIMTPSNSIRCWRNITSRIPKAFLDLSIQSVSSSGYSLRQITTRSGMSDSGIPKRRSYLDLFRELHARSRWTRTLSRWLRSTSCVSTRSSGPREWLQCSSKKWPVEWT